MNTKQKVLWITRTAIFIALLVVAQAFSKPMGQMVTGSLVNLILILSVLLGGLACGIAAALLSPLFAFFLGIGPALVPVLPFVMLGNTVLVLLWHFVAGKANKFSIIRYLVALALGAVLKFAVLYLGIVVLLVGLLLPLPEAQATVLSAAFSYPQFITAAIGGAAALLLAPVLKKALRQSAAG